MLLFTVGRPTRIQLSPISPNWRPRRRQAAQPEPRHETPKQSSEIVTDSPGSDDEDSSDDDNESSASQASTFSKMCERYRNGLYRTAREDRRADRTARKAQRAARNTTAASLSMQPNDHGQGQASLRARPLHDASPASSDNALPLLPQQSIRTPMHLPFASPAQPSSSVFTSALPMPAQTSNEQYHLSRPPAAPRWRPSPPSSPTPRPRARASLARRQGTRHSDGPYHIENIPRYIENAARLLRGAHRPREQMSVSDLISPPPVAPRRRLQLRRAVIDWLIQIR